MCLFAAPVAAGAVAAGSAATAATATSAATITAIQIASLAATVAGAGVAAYGAYQGAQAQKSAANANAKIAANNQKVAGWQAEDAKKRAGEEDIESRRKYAQLRGQQVTALAGSGVDISEGSALNMLEDTNMFEGIDSQRIRNNGLREAWGYEMQGQNYAGQAGMYKAQASGYSPLTASGTTLLTGAGEVAEKWYRFKAA